MRLPVATFLVLGLLLGACAERDISMRVLEQGGDDGPEEFAVLPVKPLETPTNFSELPPPTPGASNRTDPTPKADAIAALGGNPARVNTGGVPASDSGLVRHTARYGVPGNIRETLAEEDLAFRKRMSLFGRIRVIKVDRYSQSYRRFRLDPYAEANRFRRAGVPVPSYPPQ